LPVFIFYLATTVLVIAFVAISIRKLPFGVGWYAGQMCLAGVALLVYQCLFSIFHFALPT